MPKNFWEMFVVVCAFNLNSCVGKRLLLLPLMLLLPHVLLPDDDHGRRMGIDGMVSEWTCYGYRRFCSKEEE